MKMVFWKKEIQSVLDSARASGIEVLNFDDLENRLRSTYVHQFDHSPEQYQDQINYHQRQHMQVYRENLRAWIKRNL